MARFGEINAQYFDDAGDPLGSGKIYFYETGTTTLKTTYSDINQTIANTNPVILTAAGRQPNIFFSGTAKAILVDKNDVQIVVRDPVGATASIFGDEWIATKIYSADAVVLGSDGQYYRSKVAGNQNNNPISSSGFWGLLYSVQWNSGITYQEGAVVTYDGEQYQSLQNANLNNNPSIVPTYWTLLSFAWLSTATYADNQNAVGSDGVLYTSQQAANTGNDPTDPANRPTYWVGTSADAAASAAAAAASEAAAAASESAAATSESNAAASESAAAASETAAAASESAAATSETNAAASASAASTSETNAAASETAAAASASAASTSETNAAASASAASTSETNAAASETAAAASETAAAASESAAATSETNASNSATAASTSASNAATSESNASDSADAAAASAAAAAASYDAFDDRYLGDKASDPTLDNDGNALLTGALYFNTTSDVMKVYDGSAWNIAAISSASPTFTGTVTADGLTVDGDAVINDTIPQLQLMESDTTDLNSVIKTTAGQFRVQTINDAANSTTNRFIIDHSTGDISLYEDTGTTAKFFWDASAESLGIGTTSPTDKLHIHENSSSGCWTHFTNSTTGTDALVGAKIGIDSSENIRILQYGAKAIRFYTTNTEVARIDSSGNVGVGTSSPAYTLDVSGDARFYDANGSSANYYFESDHYCQVNITSDKDASNGGPYNTAITANGSNGNLELRTNSLQRVSIDQSGNVGIGTTSPNISGFTGYTVTSIQGSNGAVLELADSTYVNAIWSSDDNLTLDADRTNAGADSYMRFRVDTAEAMRIDSSGNVGIGIDSPNNIGAGVTTLDLGGNDATQADRSGGVTFTRYDGTRGMYIAHVDSQNLFAGLSTYPMVFRTNNTERLRIDSSGNLLVGTTNANPTSSGVNDPGVELSNTGGVRSTVASNPAATFNRKTDDGQVVLFRKDGTTVGNIGVKSGEMYLGSANTGVRFYDAGDAITPFDVTGAAGRDNAIDIGVNTTRFKDLYLSGGVYLGGTGAANKLDDYEEGTFTVTPTFGTSGSATLDRNLLSYTKIGQVVYITGQIQFDVLSSPTGRLSINAPFAQKSAAGSDRETNSFFCGTFQSLDAAPPTGTDGDQLWFTINGSEIELFFYNGYTNTATEIDTTYLKTASRINITGWYLTT
jgi:flagellar biosynthesis GTPase FlhF